MARREGNDHDPTGRVPSLNLSRRRQPRSAVLALVGATFLALGGPTTVAGASAPPVPIAAPTVPVGMPVTVPVGMPVTVPVAVPRVEDFTDGLRVEATTTYTVDLAASVVRVEYVATLTNQVPDRVTGSYVEESYWPSYSVAILVGTTNVAARRDGGGGLGVQVAPGDGEFCSVAVIDLSPDLFYDNTQTIRLTYDLPTQPPGRGRPPR